MHVEARWRTMGCDAGVWLTGDRPRAELEALADAIRADVGDVAARLTRFDPASELCRLNADERTVVPASTVLRRFVRAARHAGVVTDGLVDVTRLADVEATGYVASLEGREAPIAPAHCPAGGPAARAYPARPPGADADAPAADTVRRRSGRATTAAPAVVGPPRRPAGAHPDRAYLRLEAGLAAVVRPPGVRLDSGGIGKGLAADAAARRVPADVRYAISIGGDLAVGGPGPHAVDVLRAVPPTGGRSTQTAGRPRVVLRRRSAAPDVAHRLDVPAGGVATSGVHTRAWIAPDGRPAHHLIDPATGHPAWTGLVAVTAVGEDAVEAETLAKAALLSGPDGARRWLRHGGVLQHDDGRVEVVGGRSARAAA